MSKQSKQVAEDAKKLILEHLQRDTEAQAAQQQRHFDRVTDLQSRSVAALERIADTLATLAKQQRRSRRLKRGTPEVVEPTEPFAFQVTEEDVEAAKT